MQSWMGISGPLHGKSGALHLLLLLKKFRRWCQRGGYPNAHINWKVSGAKIYLRRSRSLVRPENVPSFIEAVKRREKVLSGFGHRWVFVRKLDICVFFNTFYLAFTKRWACRYMARGQLINKNSLIHVHSLFGKQRMKCLRCTVACFRWLQGSHTFFCLAPGRMNFLKLQWLSMKQPWKTNTLSKGN